MATAIFFGFGMIAAAMRNRDFADYRPGIAAFGMLMAVVFDMAIFAALLYWAASI